MNTKKLNIKFYQNIGKVFFAIAKADNIVNKYEIEALKKIVKEQWLEVDETLDIFETDAAYQIEVIFDWLHSKNASSEDCFKDFIEYYHNHLFFFSNDIKKLITNTCVQIANAFAGKNKSELILLARLNFELNDLAV